MFVIDVQNFEYRTRKTFQLRAKETNVQLFLYMDIGYTCIVIDRDTTPTTGE